jgi:hypothetical protein
MLVVLDVVFLQEAEAAMVLVRTSAWTSGTHLERSRVRDPDGQVREHGQEFVGLYATEGEVVSDFVDSEEQVVVCRPTNHIGGDEEAGSKRVRVAEQVCNAELEGDHEKSDVFSERLMAHELGDLHSRGHQHERERPPEKHYNAPPDAPSGWPCGVTGAAPLSLARESRTGPGAVQGGAGRRRPGWARRGRCAVVRGQAYPRQATRRHHTG